MLSHTKDQQSTHKLTIEQWFTIRFDSHFFPPILNVFLGMYERAPMNYFVVWLARRAIAFWARTQIPFNFRCNWIRFFQASIIKWWRIPFLLPSLFALCVNAINFNLHIFVAFCDMMTVLSTAELNLLCFNLLFSSSSVVARSHQRTARQKAHGKQRNMNVNLWRV